MIDAGFDLLRNGSIHFDVFGECGVRFASNDPTEIAFDIHTAQRALEALDHRPEFGFIQAISFGKWTRRVYSAFPDRIYHVYKDAIEAQWNKGILAGHINFVIIVADGISAVPDAVA